MIAHINGTLLNKSAESVIIDVAGVGYEVFIPLSTFYHLPEVGERAALNIFTSLRDDAIVLFGFGTTEEKAIFKLLMTVSGVGPKLAKNILSGISVEDFLRAVAAEELAKLVAVPGLGKKTGERLILELKDKAREMAAASTEGEGEEGSTVIPGLTDMESDVVSALVNLGYKERQAREAVTKVGSEESADFEHIFKETLKQMTGK
ncbi:MAG: Holliday junction branch migration protein RuvA [Thermodesulfobacteriota bacterium]